MNNILVIDDEIQTRKLLEVTLISSGYHVVHTGTAKEGLFAAASQQPDVILLDLSLPDESGQDTLKKLREWYQNPVLVLSTNDNEKDVIQSLDNGANDFVIKPFRTGELLARIRSALRTKPAIKINSVIKYEEFEMDLAARTVKINEVLVKLTATQYALLALLVKNQGKILTHEYLLKEIWGKDYINQLQYLRVFVAQLRKKIENKEHASFSIITESSIGYRFVSRKNQ